MSEAHPAPYPVGTRCPFPRVKCNLGVMLTTNLHLVLKSRMVGAIPPFLPVACMVVAGQLLLFFIHIAILSSPVAGQQFVLSSEIDPQTKLVNFLKDSTYILKSFVNFSSSYKKSG
jgi:hypothetical protein